MSNIIKLTWICCRDSLKMLFFTEKYRQVGEVAISCSLSDFPPCVPLTRPPLCCPLFIGFFADWKGGKNATPPQKSYQTIYSFILVYFLLPLWHVYQGYVNVALYLPLHRPSRLELGSNGRQGKAVHILGYMPYGETLLDLSQWGYETPWEFAGFRNYT